MARISGLAKLISTMKTICKVIALFGPGIKEFVPEANKTDYQNALDSILSACAVLQAIDYQDSSAGTSAPWGS